MNVIASMPCLTTCSSFLMDTPNTPVLSIPLTVSATRPSSNNSLSKAKSPLGSLLIRATIPHIRFLPPIGNTAQHILLCGVACNALQQDSCEKILCEVHEQTCC